MLGALSVGLGAPAFAQNVLAPAPAASASADAEDPVSRFLSEGATVPSTKPVVEMAQQVRSRRQTWRPAPLTSAMDFLGVPYKLGGTSRETGFDCSGFTRRV